MSDRIPRAAAPRKPDAAERLFAVETVVAEMRASVAALASRDAEIERAAAAQLREALESVTDRFERMLTEQRDKFTDALAGQAKAFDDLLRAALARMALSLAVKWGERAFWPSASAAAAYIYTHVLMVPA